MAAGIFFIKISVKTISYFLVFIQVVVIQEPANVSYLTIREDNGLVNTPSVLLFSFPFPGIDWNPSYGNGSGGMILSTEDVTAAPHHLFQRAIKIRLTFYPSSCQVATNDIPGVMQLESFKGILSSTNS
jgi:hypothetical protein